MVRARRRRYLDILAAPSCPKGAESFQNSSGLGRSSSYGQLGLQVRRHCARITDPHGRQQSIGEDGGRNQRQLHRILLISVAVWRLSDSRASKQKREQARRKLCNKILPESLVGF